MGLGKKIIHYGSCLLFNSQKNIQTIIAFVKEDNIPSIKSFLSVGYTLSGIIEKNSETFLKFILSRKSV